MRILHFVHDQFFIPWLISTFRYLGTDSRFVCLYEGMPSRKCISEANGVEFIEIGSSAYHRLVDEKSYDVVWLHPLMPERVRFVNELKDKSTIIVWSSWGADLYGLLGNRLLGWRTTLKWSKSVSFIKIIKTTVRHLIVGMGLRKLVWPQGYRRFMKHIDFFSMVIDNEGALARKLLPKNAKQVSFHYTCLSAKNDDQQTLPACDSNAHCIWVGNSATFTNNYFDVFPILKRYHDYHIYAPLSYGPDGAIVDEEGRRCFGEHWHPYFDFVPVDEYRRRMTKCSIFVFGHYRQGGLGNILIALKVGGCVFLSPRNPVYQFLLDNGITIYTLQDLNKRLMEVLIDFKSKRSANMDRARQIWSRDVMEHNIRNTIEILEKEVRRRG